MEYQQDQVREPFWRDQKQIALLVFVFGAVLCLLAPGGPRILLMAKGIVGLVVLWNPGFWVWLVPRRHSWEAAPIQYVHVFGWAALLFWLGTVLWRVFGSIDP